MADEGLWSTRNIAEFAYCPRLFYLMEVEGIHLASADTEKGLAVHRRVDKPSAAPEPDAPEAETDPDRPKVARSLTLTCQALGLTATLDIAEIEGTTAVPVEYRKGRPRRAPLAPPPDTLDFFEGENQPLATPQPWPTDRIQLTLQAILLEKSGYTVPHGILYYATEKLRLPVEITHHLRQEALATLEDAKRSAQGNRPLPLINDPKCSGCSLQPFCLPDEVNFERASEADDVPNPRKIWPPRDDGIHVVVQAQGVKIGVNGMTMRVTNKDGEKLKEMPLVGMESLTILGMAQITTQALHALAEREIPVAFLSGAGRLVGVMEPAYSVSAHVRKAQVKRFDDPAACLELTRALISAKITNQRTLLMRNHVTLPDDVPTRLARQTTHAAKGENMDSVRGYEGEAAALYFEHFSGMFRAEGPAAEFAKNGRQRRPPPDPINACISMAYSMLANECIAALRVASLEPGIGAFHVSRPGRPSLALDLMEPFRPLIADSLAVSIFNRNEVTEGHFMRSAAGCLFTDAGRRVFFNAYGRRMETEITHPVFGYRLTYRRMLILHARMIAAWLLGDVPTLSFLTTR